MREYILGIDVGGSKIEAALYPCVDNAVLPDAVWQAAQDTRRGITAHGAQIAALIALAMQEAPVACAGIATPGRFDAAGAVRPGSNPNLGLSAGEFDGIKLTELYAGHLAAPLPLFILNDAQAMLAGLIHREAKGRFHGRQVALLGIGTGIGHAIARVAADGSCRFITDGHASKLCLPLDVADSHRLRALSGVEIIWCGEHAVRAEDAMRGPVIAALAGVIGNRAIDPADPAHVPALAFAGIYMARLIALIASGEAQDIIPAQGWSPADKAEAAKTQEYLISGGFGASRAGEAVMAYARRELDRLGHPAIALTHMAQKAPATYAAAQFAAARRRI